MHLRHVVTLGSFAITLALASLSAQSTSSTQTTAPDPGKWSFSLGADPRHFDLNTPEPGVDARVVANLTRSWQSAHSRWTRHISLMVGADAPVQVQPGVIGFFDPQCDCPMRISRRYVGLTAGVSYDLFRVSRFTPYITGGTGVYSTAIRRSPVRDFLTPSELAFYQQSGGFAQNNFSLGVNAGLGLKMRLGSHQLFIEQMVHRFDINQLGTGIDPLNIGIRF
jgi:opacity protein-like surface antigen